MERVIPLFNPFMCCECVWETWEASSCHWWESHICFMMWRHIKRLTSRREIKLHAEIGLKGFFFDLAASRSKSNCWDDTTLETDQLFKEAICYCRRFQKEPIRMRLLRSSSHVIDGFLTPVWFTSVAPITWNIDQHMLKGHEKLLDAKKFSFYFSLMYANSFESFELIIYDGKSTVISS